MASMLLLGPAGCGDDGGAGADAGTTSNYSLEILTPPGDSIGLDFSGTTTLRVRYLDDQGQPLPNEIVAFNLLDSGDESTGGASLSAADNRTDAMGIAEIDLVAGAERVNYRVQASATQAPSVLFYIQVSDQGFVNLQIHSAHEGPRDPTAYLKVQLRIYANHAGGCEGIDFDNLPQSFLQPRTQDQIGDVSEFVNLPAEDAYTVLAYAEIDGIRPLAVTCLTLPADRLRSGRTFSAVMSLVDRHYEFEQPLDVETIVDLTPVTSTLVGANAWRQLRCPFGHAELLLDCLADAQATDGLMDCDGSSTSALSTGLDARRGMLDADGCRLALDSGGASSIDALLQAELDTATSSPSPAERSALADGYAALTESIRITSLLTATSAGTADHRLLEATLGTETTDLLASDRPVVESVGVPFLLDAQPLLGLTNHAFTLRYGEIASSHYETLALVPANLGGLGATLGDTFMTGIAIDAATGCGALETFVCNELSLPGTCADQCSGVASELNTLLAGWQTSLQSSGVDFELGFAATLPADDNNLRIDSISADSFVDAASISVTLTTDIDTQLLPAQLTASAVPATP
jgi:hypothetical protein